MARWTDFGVVRSDRDLLLIQQSVDVQPAEPKLNLIDVPGADGSKDLTELPGGRVTYKDRKITWTFALQPGEPWAKAFQRVSGAINGRRCNITLHNDPDYYYRGRVVVKSHKLDGVLRQIVVEATCRPYKLSQFEQTVTRQGLGTSYSKIILLNDRMPVVPVITVTADTMLRWKGAEYAINAGTHKLLDLELQEGDNVIEAKVVGASTGAITFTYRGGAL